MADIPSLVPSEQDKKARIIIEKAFDAFLEIDVAGIVIDWNARAEILFGWSKDEALGVELVNMLKRKISR